MRRKIDMELYWVSLIIQDTENSKPWLSAMSNGCVNLEEAMETIKRGRNEGKYMNYVKGKGYYVGYFDENDIANNRV